MDLMYLLLLTGLFFLEVSGAENELNAVVVIFRHGDRTPISPYPKDPYRNRSYWPVDYGQLTNLGKEQHYELGLWLRSRYDNFLPKTYSDEDIYVISTDVDRTLMSAEANLAGLYRPIDKDVWNPNLKWQPIPIHTTPQELDALLAGKKPCPKFTKLKKTLYTTDYFKNITNQNRNLYAYLANNTGESIEDLQDIQNLYSNLFIENLYNYSLPPWTAKVFPDKLKPLASLAFAVDTFTLDMARLKSGLLFNYIIDFFNNRTSKTPETRKMLILSAHDSTIGNVLNSMGAFEYHCPPYTSTILFELKKRVNGDNFINIFYKNSSIPRQIKLRECEYDCTLANFIKILKPITLNLKKWEIECKLRWDFVWPLTFQWNIILLCSLITMVLLLSAVLVGIKKSREECDNKYIQLPNEEYA